MMVTNLRVPAALIGVLLVAAACGGAAEPAADAPPAEPSAAVAPPAEPTTAVVSPAEPTAAVAAGAPDSASQTDYIQVQHVLISFKGAGTSATRSQEEAKTLADEVFAKAKEGADFDALVKEYTDDSPPGIYAMSNTGIAPDPAKEQELGMQVYPRTGMVPAFGDIGFNIAVGEIGMAEFDAERSPFGWHIIKRLK